MILIGSAGTASAQGGRPSDPQADSPAGTVYKIPFDDGRKDGAPRARAPRGEDPSPSSDLGGAATGGAGDSPIRSENNFGSSSQVPGVAKSGERPATDGDGRAEGDEPGGSDRPATAARLSAVSGSTDEGAPSSALTVSLLALIAVVGIAVGTGAARARRRL